MYLNIRIPTDAEQKVAWENALRGVDCGSSAYICIEHFTPESYTIQSGRINLNTRAVPSIFDIMLIDVDEEEITHINEFYPNESVINTNELQTLQNENAMLRREIEKIKTKQEREKNTTNARFETLNTAKQKQTKKIRSLKQQLKYVKKRVEQLQKHIADMKEGKLSVDINVCFSYMYEIWFN